MVNAGARLRGAQESNTTDPDYLLLVRELNIDLQSHEVELRAVHITLDIGQMK